MYETLGRISFVEPLSALKVRNTVNDRKTRPSTNSSGSHTLIHENMTHIAVGI